MCTVFCYCLLWHMFIFMSVVVTVWVCGNVCSVVALVKDSGVFLALEC